VLLLEYYNVVVMLIKRCMLYGRVSFAQFKFLNIRYNVSQWAIVCIDISTLIPFNLRDFLRNPARPGPSMKPAHCNNASSCRAGRFGASRLPETARPRPWNTMDGSGVTPSVSMLTLWPSPWHGTCNDTYPSRALSHARRVTKEEWTTE